MAESVGQDDFGWFTPADLKQVILAIHQLQDWKKVILVGGQSLTAWVEYYKIELPAFEGPYLTADADFLGTKAEARVIASYLRGKAQIPKIDDHTPNTATIEFTGEEGTKLLIDMLVGVLVCDFPDWDQPISPDWTHLKWSPAEPQATILNRSFSWMQVFEP